MVITPPGTVTQPTPPHDPKRPYGGLVQTQSKGARAYPDAATYNQQLAQHQAYTAAQASQASAPVRNPYINPQNAQQQQQQQQSQQQQSVNNSYPTTPGEAYPSGQGQQYGGQYGSGMAHGMSHHASSGQLNPGNSQYSSGSNLGTGHLSGNVSAQGNYYPNQQQRTRAGTVNQMDSGIPPALARLQHMKQDIIGGRNALTPVLNRDDAMREWERRQSGKPPAAAQPYQPLEYLQQQAEMVAAQGGLANWGAGGHQARYPAQPSKLQHSYQPHIMVDDENAGGGAGGSNARRDVVMQNVRAAAARGDSGASGLYGGNAAPAAMISSPPQAYTGGGAQGAGSAGARYGGSSYGQASSGGAGSSSGGFDYMPMPGEQYQGYQVNTATGASRLAAGGGQQQQQVPASFYGPGVVPSGQQQQRNPFNAMGPDSQQQKDGRWQQR